MTKEYTALLLDRDGYELAGEAPPLPSLKAAKDRARLLMSASFLDGSGTTHGELGSYKVEVRDAAGVCVWDVFL